MTRFINPLGFSNVWLYIWCSCWTMIFHSTVSNASSAAFGTLTNFDVINDENEDCHGFEIELEGIHREDILDAFGGTFSRYGDPVLFDKKDKSGNIIGVFVRYSSAVDVNGNFLQVTVIPPAAGRSTNGHACYNGGSIGADYDQSGCEHFGVSFSYSKQPTATFYRWLKADPHKPGELIASLNNIDIPGVTWSQLPAQNNAQNFNRVVVEIPDRPSPICYRYGEAKWVKVTVTKTEYEVELDDLLSDSVVIEETETEIEWKLVQAQPTCDDDGQVPSELPENKLQIEDNDVSDSSKSIVRRFEFYKYTGPYDRENNEATPVKDDEPLPSEIGDYIGAQMAAVRLAEADGSQPSSPTPPPTSSSTPRPTSSPTPPKTSSPTPPLTSSLASPLTSSPIPPLTTSPTSSPTTATFNFWESFCFSGENVVIEKVKGPIAMKDLRIGDMVKVGNNRFDRVYSFGHYDQTAIVEYLRIHTTGDQQPLEITRSHMLFVDKNVSAVPAGSIKVGDRLLAVTMGEEPIEVNKIDSVLRRGAFAPFTYSGLVGVNGIVGSSYIAFLDDTNGLVFGNQANLLSMQWLAHISQAPHRVVCLLSWKFCEEETYTKRGLSRWIDWVVDFSLSLLVQPMVVATLLCTLLLFLAWTFAVIEYFILNPTYLVLLIVSLWVLFKHNLRNGRSHKK